MNIFDNRQSFWCPLYHISREGTRDPLQYSCLENPMDGGVWWAVVHGVAKSRTWLSDFTFTFYFHALEKEMATHSSVLAWRIPGTGSLVGCPLWGCTELDRTDVTAATYHISHAYMWIISILLSDLAYIDHKHLQFQTSLLFFFSSCCIEMLFMVSIYYTTFIESAYYITCFCFCFFLMLIYFWLCWVLRAFL